jgi:hypothetical protein
MPNVHKYEKLEQLIKPLFKELNEKFDNNVYGKNGSCRLLLPFPQ